MAAAEASGSVEAKKLAPGKDAAAFRVYDATADAFGVRAHYEALRSHQSHAFSARMREQWSSGWGQRGGQASSRMTVRDALRLADSFIDRSDPDTAMPNSIHMLQSAEGARAAGKPEWMQLCALIHDIGKIMYAWSTPEDGQGGKADEAQWALGGDTFVVGCALPACTVYPELNALSPDAADARFASANGVYAPGCGVMSLDFSFGHDEYAYLWALHNKVAIPREGLAMLRLHSCYPWHTGGAYRQFHAEGDDALLAAVLEFNVYDLYTKSDSVPDIDACWPHYQAIIDKLCPGVLDW